MEPNEERLAFYSEIGRTVTQWATVEFALAQIVSGAYTAKDAALATAGFHSIENFRSKLQHVDSILAQRGLTASQKAKWDALFRRCESAAKKRNALAHRWVLNVISAKPGRRIILLPTKPSGNSSRQRYPGALGLRDVVSYRQEFFALLAALENFDARLHGRKEPHAKDQEQPKPPPDLAALRRGLHASIGRPPKP